MNRPISLRIGVGKHYAMVRIGGELDIASAPATRDFLLHALIGHDKRLIVDVQGVTFIDSTGIAALQSARQEAVRRGGWVNLVGPGPQFRKVLHLLQATVFLPAYASAMDAAVAENLLAAPG